MWPSDLVTYCRSIELQMFGSDNQAQQLYYGLEFLHVDTTYHGGHPVGIVRDKPIVFENVWWSMKRHCESRVQVNDSQFPASTGNECTSP
ncbi:hypothetical protein HNY73_001732 [Argiope bruennichi]|uniref:Uncharacterized protein n=1 Tax=Argiope bruennichi TaxID=94029 RepID=A0A8T0FSS5_ARGBR|nr:hypothetical protein HNY73_001732 [Argiope bruennichi]